MCWQHSAVAEVPHVSKLDVGISSTFGMARSATRRQSAQRGTSSHHTLQPTATAASRFLATAWLNPVIWWLSCFLPGNKTQLGYVKKLKKTQWLFSSLKWGCENISCIQAQKITTALGSLNLGEKSRISVSKWQGWFLVQVEKFNAYLCVMAAHSRTTISGVTVVVDLFVPGVDGSFHGKYRERASPDVFSNRGKPGVSLPWLFEVRVMFKLASLRPSFRSLRQIWIPTLQDKDK